MILSKIHTAWPIPVPAAGDDWVLTVPAGKIWRIRALYLTLITDANIATRTPKSYYYNSTGDIIINVYFDYQQEASDALTWQWLDSLVLLNALRRSDCLGILADIYMPEETSLSPLTVNLQAGDQWGFQGCIIEEYLAPGYG